MRMWRVLSLFSLLLYTFGDNAWAISVAAKVDRTTIGLEEQFTYVISVEGSRSVEEPGLPDLRDFEVSSQGASTRMQIINGAVSSGIDFTYVLTPKRLGTLRIGPARAEVEGKMYQTNEIEITVSQSAPVPESAGRELFIETTVSNPKPYVGEAVVLTFAFYRKVGVGNANLDKPSYNGFLSEQLTKERDYGRIVNGQEYHVYETRDALYPLAAGTHTIPPFVLKAEVKVRDPNYRSPFSGFFDDSFFGARMVTKTLKTKPFAMFVRDVPQMGKPADYSGLVGSFSLAAKLSTSTLKVGESATLTYTVSGYGNLKNIARLPGPDLKEFKVYDDKPALRTNTIAELFMEKTFKKAIVPLHAGSFTIPPVRLSYFNPRTERYEVASSAAFPLTIQPAMEEERLHAVEGSPNQVLQRSPETVGGDILELKDDLSRFGNNEPLANNPLTYGAFVLPPCAYAVGAWLQTRRRRREEESEIYRAKGALKKAYAALDNAEQHPAARIDDRADAALKIIRTYLGDKTGRTGEALTTEEFDAVIAGKAFQLTSSWPALREFMLNLEAASYGGAQLPTGETFEQRARMLLKDLDREVLT